MRPYVAAKLSREHNIVYMKKVYLVPELNVLSLSVNRRILTVSSTSGEDLNVRSFGEEEGEDVGTFWN